MRLRAVRIAGALAVLSFAPTAHASSTADDYRVVHRSKLAEGVEHRVLVGEEPDQVVQVARIEPSAPVEVRSVVSHDAVRPAAGAERTSSMCRRLRCLLAVNGDFMVSGTGESIGGAVVLGEPVRSPPGRYPQLVVRPDGGLTIERLRWRGRIVSTDLREISVELVNVPRPRDAIVLYTPSFGKRTATRPDGTELVARIVRPDGPLRLDRTSVLRLVELHEDSGATAIPADGAVLSGHGRGAGVLERLWQRTRGAQAGRDVLVRLESATPVAESVGGHPHLVADGRPAFRDAPTGFVRGRHPRTLLGLTKEKMLLLVTVDGRQPGYAAGMTLAEAAELMIDLGAVEALNLDGGGSTTFVIGGRVMNRPSDRLVRRDEAERLVHEPGPNDTLFGHVERPVGSAVVIVAEDRRAEIPRSAAAVEIEGAPALDVLDVPAPVPRAASPGPDPASDPTSSSPVVVMVVRPGRDLWLLSSAIGAVSLALALAFVDVGVRVTARGGRKAAPTPRPGRGARRRPP